MKLLCHKLFFMALVMPSLSDAPVHVVSGSPARPQRRFLAVLLATLVLGNLLCLASRPYDPVQGDPLLETWRWRTFPELNGLGANCMVEGADGSVWFGMSSGIWKFDGINWLFYSQDAFGVGGALTMARSPDGTIYAGHRAMISRFTDGKWKNIAPFGQRRFGDLRKIVVARDGTLWGASSWGAIRFRDDKWVVYTSPDIARQLPTDKPRAEVQLLPQELLSEPRLTQQVRRHNFVSVAEDQQGRIWFGTEEGEVLCFNPGPTSPASGGAVPSGAWTLYNEADGLVCGRVPCILPTQDGSVWVAYGAGSGNLNIFDGNAWRTTRLADLGMPEWFGEIIQTRDGVVWCSANYVVCACRNGQWRRYELPEVPIPRARNFMMQSSDGSLWIAGPSTEIQRIDYQTPRWLTLQDLNFQWESPSGAEWFLHRQGRVVVRNGDHWTCYGAEDGAIDTPVALLGTRTGEVWAAGSHEGTAATARFDGQQWTRFVHDELSWGIEWRGIMESSDGSLWFSAAVDSNGPRQHRNGILQYKNGKWIHHHQPGYAPSGADDSDPSTLLPATQRPEPKGKFLCMGESPDGRIWAGRNIFTCYDGQKWSIYTQPPGLRLGVVETFFTTPDRVLWAGTRQFGAARYDGRNWQQFQGKDSLVANTVRSFAQTTDGTLWAATDRDISRFDGVTWTGNLLPDELTIPHEGGKLVAGASGGLWINHFTPDWMRRGWSKAARINVTNCVFYTVRHQFQGRPPETFVTVGSREVSHPGNLSISWSGAAPWRESKDTRLQFSFRMDNQSWSPFTAESGHSFFTLPGGLHHFEVRARDQDFNVDPTPAALDVVVLPPVWRQSWFLLLLAVLTGLIIAQSVRVFLERSELRRTNRVLADEVKERERAEQALQRLNTELDQRVKARTTQLEIANRELEAFSYSVSHDLRAPLRSIDGFSRTLLEDYEDKLDDSGKEDLRSVRSASQRMGQLIDDMLMLAKVTRSEMRRVPLDLSAMAGSVARELQQGDPNRRAEFIIAPGLTTEADPGLMRIVLENLLGNAWKFSGRNGVARIEFGRTVHDGVSAYFVRDNGVGFDMSYSNKLFGAFQRLHSVSEFPGTGIGLATVQRIIQRQGGRVWAESAPGEGATFYFTVSV